MTRNVKIVATVGPASQSEDTLEQLIQAGMNVARMNFSHGTHEQHLTRIELIRKVSKKIGVPVGILQDLQGQNFRTGNGFTSMRPSLRPRKIAGKKSLWIFDNSSIRCGLQTGFCSTMDA